MEASPNQISKTERTKSLELTNMMQFALAQKSGLDEIKWINQYAASFRNIIESELELIEDYKSKPEETLKIIKKRLPSQLH